MSKVQTCPCGRKTTNPYVIRGIPYCVDCAEERAPSLVASRIRRDWRNWNGGKGVYPYSTTRER